MLREQEKNNKKRITKIVKASLQDLCECEKERYIQDILATRLKAKARITLSSKDYPDIEIDILGEDFIIETKYNDNYYAGFDQIMAQRILYDFPQNFLIHIHEFLNPKYIKAFSKLSKNLEVSGILINKRKVQIEVII